MWNMVFQSADFGRTTNVVPLLRSLTSGARKPNVLVSCREGDSEAVLGHLARWCARPVRCCAFPGPLCLPPDRNGTLLLDGVNRMTLSQQIALYDWVNPRVGGLHATADEVFCGFESNRGVDGPPQVSCATGRSGLPAPRGPQIVSLTTTELLPLVMEGAFLEGLFYRLNVVQLEAA